MKSLRDWLGLCTHFWVRYAKYEITHEDICVDHVLVLQCKHCGLVKSIRI